MTETLHPAAAYWDRGVRNVPDMTGAKHLLDAQDFPVIFAALDMPERLPNVLDVGCGTGRLAKWCDGYAGMDISPSMVEYCRAKGLWATLITGPQWVVPDVQWIACISVFTHIGRDERRDYLRSFCYNAPNALVDILPGDGSGAIEFWTADPDEFVADCIDAGFDVLGSVDHQWGVHTHRYYRLQRAG